MTRKWTIFASFAYSLSVLCLLGGGEARADGPCTGIPITRETATPARAPATWGKSDTAASRDESPVARARELLTRAKFLDEAAANDDKAAADLQQRLPALRASAKATRDRAGKATGDDHEILLSIAEDLEADVAISEAETTDKRHQAVENRRAARDLRTHAVKLVREAPTNAEAASSKCDPPYRFTPDGRKTYLFECLD